MQASIQNQLGITVILAAHEKAPPESRGLWLDRLRELRRNAELNMAEIRHHYILLQAVSSYVKCPP
jgi:hypothetical protein